MLFVLVLAVLIAFSYEPPRGAAVAGGASPLAIVVLATAALWLLADVFARVTVRHLERQFDRRESILRGYQRLRWAHVAVLLAGYAALVHGLGWPAVVRRGWGLERWILLDDILVLAPFLAALVLAWSAQYRVEDFVRQRLAAIHNEPPLRWSRGVHFELLLRHHLGVVLIPTFILITLVDLTGLIPNPAVRQTAELAVGLPGIAAVLVCAPLLLRVLWRARPLPPGPLRTRLELLSRRLRFRASDILVWDTRGAVINAAVSGIVPWLRYVLLSDGLLAHLTDDEIEAVFGHEVGHIRHHHLYYYIAFLQGAGLFLVTAMGLSSRLMQAGWAGPPREAMLALLRDLAVPGFSVALYFGIFFGFLSRRFEREADVFGCRAVSCGRSDCPPHHLPPTAAALALCPAGIQTFVTALEKISLLNGAPRETRSWRHFSIAKRVAFLETLAACPQLERRFRRVVLGLKAAVILGLLTGGWWILAK